MRLFIPRVSVVTVVRLLIALAALSFLLTLRAEYMGEEAVYSLLSLEMHHYGSYLTPIQYGAPYGRPPLFNWLIIPLADWLGWKHVLQAARIVTALATLATGSLTFWIACASGLTRRTAELAALVFLSMTYALFWYGWISYSDALFGFFIMLAIAAGIAAVTEKRHIWLVLACLALIAGFLTKALTIYVFYAVSMLVLAVRQKSWGFLLHWRSLLIHTAALAFPLVWWHIFTPGTSQGSSMLGDILSRLQEQHRQHYLEDQFGFIVDSVKMLLPLSLVFPVLVWLDRRRQGLSASTLPTSPLPPTAWTLLWIVALNFIPYLIAPQSNVRYVYPLTGLVAVIFAAMAASRDWERAVIVAAACFITLKFALGLAWLPAYQQRAHNFKAAALDISKVVGSAPLYVDNTAWQGLSVAANIDVMRLQHPLRLPQPGDQGYLLAYSEMPNWPVVVKVYQFGDPLYLLCRGSQCPQPVARP
jgi:4-amino-4-deoxy-L-arabinose transferase-like glycosyltransferase